MPDPVIDAVNRTNPEHEALLADSVGLALLVVLETLNPAERLAFVLHDTFGVPFEEILRPSSTVHRKLLDSSRAEPAGAYAGALRRPTPI